MQNRRHLVRRHLRVDHFHLLQENRPFLFVENWQCLQLELDVGFLIAKEGGHIEVRITGQGDFVWLFTSDLTGEVCEHDMRIGKTRYANVFREIGMFFQRLINFLFTDGVLRELVTANQQAADNQCRG